ncbi:MAG: hypothetical protein ACLR1V_14610 [Coprococcus sp.]
MQASAQALFLVPVCTAVIASGNAGDVPAMDLPIYCFSKNWDEFQLQF